MPTTNTNTNSSPTSTVACHACGYDLVGLALPTNCPGCGELNTGLEQPPSVNPLSQWIQVAITLWSFSGVVLAYSIKGHRLGLDTAAIGGRFTPQELFASAAFLAIGMTLTILCFHRRRYEASAAVAAGSALFVFILFWLRYLFK